MYYAKRRVKAAAYIRTDGELATGRSHAEIIKASPYGTCKGDSVSGFIDNHDQFISREVAWKIAKEAGQLVLAKIVKRGEYLLSEEIWSDRENGQWTYDYENGEYVKRMMEVGDTVTPTENTKVKFGYSDGMEGTVIDVLDTIDPYNLVVNFPELGESHREFFNENELIRIEK